MSFSFRAQGHKSRQHPPSHDTPPERRRDHNSLKRVSSALRMFAITLSSHYQCPLPPSLPRRHRLDSLPLNFQISESYAVRMTVHMFLPSVAHNRSRSVHDHERNRQDSTEPFHLLEMIRHKRNSQDSTVLSKNKMHTHHENNSQDSTVLSDIIDSSLTMSVTVKIQRYILTTSRAISSQLRTQTRASQQRDITLSPPRPEGVMPVFESTRLRNILVVDRQSLP